MGALFTNPLSRGGECQLLRSYIPFEAFQLFQGVPAIQSHPLGMNVQQHQTPSQLRAQVQVQMFPASTTIRVSKIHSTPVSIMFTFRSQTLPTNSL